MFSSITHNDTTNNAILNICKYDYDFFLKKTNVVGIGLGYKEIKGICTFEKCIIVYVTKKSPLALLNSEDIIPQIYKTLKTDVIESGNIEFSSLRNRIRPVPGGYNFGAALNVSGGSFGCLVRDSHNTIYMLSCNHVLAKDTFTVGTPIIQPSYRFGGMPPQDIVAILSNYIPRHPITSKTKPINYVDCAIAELISPYIASPIIAFLGIPKGINIPFLNENIKKVGSSSELTTGIIKSVGTTITINSSSGKKYLYLNQIITTALAIKGDSGSILFNYKNEILGLVIATTSKITICNNIYDIMNSLKVVPILSN